MSSSRQATQESDYLARLSRMERAAVVAVAWLTFITGLLNIFPLLAWRLEEKIPALVVLSSYQLQEWGRYVALLAGFTLIYLSFQLMQRRRVAWLIAMGASAVALFASFLDDPNWHRTVMPAIEIGLLVITRPLFVVRGETRSIRRGLVIASVGLVVLFAYGVAGFWWLEERDFGTEYELSPAILRAFQEFTLSRQPDLYPHTRHARWFLDSLQILGAATLITSSYSLFRPLVYQYRTLPRERQQAMVLVEAHGKNPLDFFKLWHDKAYFFAAERDCVIAYKTALNVAISLGDAVGQPEAIPKTTLAFLNECFQNNWKVAFHQVPPDWLPMYKELGLSSIKIGEEAIVDLEKFAATTAQAKDFRYTVRKMEKDGYHLQAYTPPYSAELLDQLRVISDDWLTIPGRRERTFTLGQFERDYLAQTPIYTVENQTGQPIAFVNLIPTYREGLAAIDLMRHQASIPNGTMDYLFTTLMLRLHEQNFRAFSLGMAPLSGIEESVDNLVVKKAMHLLYENLNRYFSYKGLRNYKAKFGPLWEDRFMVYQGNPLNLPQIVLALVRMSE